MGTLLRSNKGFSLIELMVVVAIIAILATIAVPAYNDFQSKTRQKEAQVLLSSYYSASQASRAEHGWFPGNFVAVGFNPTGQLGYRVTVADGTDPVSGPNQDACIRTNVAACVGAKWAEKSPGTVGTALGPLQVVSASDVVTNNGDFKAFASGVISLSGFQADEWGVNQVKVMKNTKDGIAGAAASKNDQTF